MADWIRYAANTSKSYGRSRPCLEPPCVRIGSSVEKVRLQGKLCQESAMLRGKARGPVEFEGASFEPF